MARWEIGLGDHPLYKDKGPWSDKIFNEGRSVNKLKHVSTEKAHRSVFRRAAAPTTTKAMSVITIESDEDEDDVVFVGITPKSEPDSHSGMKRKRGHGGFSTSAAEAIEVYDSDLDPPTPTPLSRQTAPPTIQSTVPASIADDEEAGINEGAGEVSDPVAN